jgi:hypothetical protein
VPRHFSFVGYYDEVVRFADTLSEATPDNNISPLRCLLFYKAGSSLEKIELFEFVAVNSERIVQFIAAARVKAVDEDLELLILSAHRVELHYKKQR